MPKKALIAACVLLLAYFVFTSGLVFNLTSNRIVSRVDMPYNMALGGEEEGVLGVFNTDDVSCAKWLVENNRLPIHADYNGGALLMGYLGDLERVDSRYVEEHYLFLTSWNTKYSKMVIGSCPALRAFEPLPTLTNAIEVYRRGNAVVYLINSPETKLTTEDAMHVVGASTAGDSWTQGAPYQRYTFFAATRYWCFYSDGTSMGFVSSPDGVKWNTFTAIRASSLGPNFSVVFDGTYIHYVYSPVWTIGGDVYYRMGQPNSDGTITWLQAEQTVKEITGTQYTSDPHIIVDSNGYPWVSHGVREAGKAHAWLAKSSTKNGVWTNEATLFTSPYQFSDSVFICTSNPKVWCMLTALDGGMVYAIAQTDGFYSVDPGEKNTKGRLWNGSSWEAEETVVVSDAVVSASHSVVAYGNDVHLIYSLRHADPSPSLLDTYYIRRSASTGWETPVLIEAAGIDAGRARQSLLSVDDDGTLYCFWTNWPSANHAYYKKCIAGIWDIDATDWIAEPSALRHWSLNVSDKPYNGVIIFTTIASSSPYSVLVKFLDVK